MEIKADKLASLLGLPKGFRIYKFEIKKMVYLDDDDTYIIEGVTDAGESHE